jgi:hypothetical protein
MRLSLFGLVLASLMVANGDLRAQSRPTSVHVGVARAEWLSPGAWAPAVGIDRRLSRRGRVALIAGAHGIINQFTPGNALTRRQHIATGTVGPEVRVRNSGTVRAFLGAAVAGSYWWYSYGPSTSFLRSGHAFDAIGILTSVRTELGRASGTALSLRADVRTVWTNDVSWSPQLGVGVAF